MKSLLFSTCLALLGTTPGLAAIDAYLLLSQNGVPVETDATHSWVSILGFEQGLTNNVQFGSSEPGGKSSATPVTLKIGQDGSIARMMQGLALGQSFDLTVHLVRPGDKSSTVLISLEFQQVLFSAIDASGSAGDDFVQFDLTFSYGKLIYTQSLLDKDGISVENTLEASADFIKGEFAGPDIATPIEEGDYTGGSPPPSGTDNDGDGMPNAWETTFGFNTENSADATIDTDGDGFTNVEEYITGTHPRSPSSFFQVQTVVGGSAPPEIRLNWNGLPGRSYQVLASSLPDSGFTAVHTVTPVGSGPLSFIPPVGSGPFFRVRVIE